jgi:hypothetical protein
MNAATRFRLAATRTLDELQGALRHVDPDHCRASFGTHNVPLSDSKML